MQLRETPYVWQDVEMKCTKCDHEYDGQGCLAAKYTPKCRECGAPGLVRFSFKGIAKYADPERIYVHKDAEALWELMIKP